MTPPPNRTGFRPPDLLRALLDHFRRRAVAPPSSPLPLWLRSGTYTFEFALAFGRLVTGVGWVRSYQLVAAPNNRAVYDIEIALHRAPTVTAVASWTVLHPNVMMMTIDGLPPSLEVIQWDYDIVPKILRVRCYA